MVPGLEGRPVCPLANGGNDRHRLSRARAGASTGREERETMHGGKERSRSVWESSATENADLEHQLHRRSEISLWS